MFRLLLLLALPVPALGARMDLGVSDLREASDVRVLAEVTSSEVRWAEGPEGGLETVVWLAPIDATRAVGEDLAVVLPGGTLGDYVHWVEHVPRFELDRRYVLFLEERPQGPRIVAGDQGVLPVRRDLDRVPWELR